MDSQELETEAEVEEEVEVEVGRTKRRRVVSAVLRCTLGFVFPFILVLFALWLYVASSSSSTDSDDSTISLRSQCKIVSSSVDLRSSQVCELGLLNYKAKNVFYPFHTNKFRCRYDYYWASVFKVEYKDHSSGQMQLAFAEAPNEALPLNCRPNFGAAWLTKDKFKVNRTYDCWYQSGISKVSLYHDGFFSCQARDPSTIEMIRRYSILSIKILQSSFSIRGGAKFWRWEMIAGVVTGFSTSLITISFLRLIHQMKLWLPYIWSPRVLPQAVNAVYLKRAGFIVIYFSVVIWLAMQYGKRLGIPEIFTALNS
ncbi:hypothetical protein ACJW30_10G006500 [Castanea mollissima]